MSKLYHVSPQTGRAGACRAFEGNCPFGTALEHFTSKEAARASYEASQADRTHVALGKPGDPLNRIPLTSGTYSAASVKDLSLRDKFRLLARDSFSPDAKDMTIPENFELLPLPPLDKRAPGDLLYSEESGRLVELRGNDGSWGTNLLTNRDISNLAGYKLVNNAFLKGGLSFDPKEFSGRRKESLKSAAVGRKDELARRKRYENDRLNVVAKAERAALYNPNAPALVFRGLKESMLSNSGLFGSGALNHYDLDTYNASVRAIGSMPGKEMDKSQLIVQERQKLLEVVRDNVEENKFDNHEDFAYNILSRVKGKFLFGDAKQRFIEEQHEEELNDQNSALYKRNRARQFARELINAPYFSEIDLRN